MIASVSVLLFALTLALASAEGVSDLYRRMPTQNSPYYGQGGPEMANRIKVYRVEKNIADAGMHAGSAIHLTRPERVTKKFDLSKLGATGPESCNLCLNVADMELQALLNFILNGVIQQDCGLLCAAALSNPIAETMCTYACDAVGIYEFIKMIEAEDLDPIYYCELLDMCPIDDCAGDCMDIIRYVSVPPKAAAGATITQYVTVKIKKPWNGTGELNWILYDPAEPNPESFGNLLIGGLGPVGTYTYALQIPTGEGSPTGEPLGCAVYTTEIQICNGQCGATHPHSRIFTQANTTFQLTC